MAQEIGGRKSIAHILGQDRLETIFGRMFDTKKEDEIITTEKTYYSDVMLYLKGTLNKEDKKPMHYACLEVDTYVYGSQKKKSPAHIKNRDMAIMETLDIPVVRIDVDALKEGRRKTKYYMNDMQIVSYVYNEVTEYWSNPEKYREEAHRG